MASAITMAHRFVPTKVLCRTRSLLLEQGKVIAAVAIMVEGATAGEVTPIKQYRINTAELTPPKNVPLTGRRVQVPSNACN